MVATANVENVRLVRATTRSLPRRACPAPVAVPTANAPVVPVPRPVRAVPVPVVRVPQPVRAVPVPVVRVPQPVRAVPAPQVPAETGLLRA